MAKLSEHSTQDLLRRFLSGEIGPREEAELDRRARHDEGLRASLAGLRAFPEEDHAARIARMRRPLPRRRQLSTVQMMSIAAGILLIVATIVFLLPIGDGQLETARSVPVASSELPERPEPETMEPASPAATTEEVAAEEEAPAERLIAPPASTPARVQAPVTASSEPESEERAADVAPAKTTNAATENFAAAPPVPTASPVAPQALEEVAVKEFELQLEADGVAAPAAKKARAQPGSPPPAADLSSRYSRMAVERKTISGYITDDQDRPIGGANITLPGQPIGEYSDSTGYFELVTGETVNAFRVSHPDYDEAAILLPRGEHEVMISLSRADRAEDADNDWMFDAARTTIYPNEEKIVARPVGGIQNLRQAINAQKPVNLPPGKVKVAFSVQPNGTLTDFDFAKKSEAILIPYVQNFLQQRSEWIIGGGNAPARVSLTFRLE